MTAQDTEGATRFVIFRTSRDHPAHPKLLHGELEQGNLRQGWGSDSKLALKDSSGTPVTKTEWEGAWRKLYGTDPRPRSFTYLRKMLDIGAGEIVVIPNMPEPGEFTIMRTDGEYRFEALAGHDDFGHIIPVDPASILKFNNKANDDAYLISGQFKGYQARVNFCYKKDCVDAVSTLVAEQKDVRTAKDVNELSNGAVDKAFKAAAMALRDEVANRWHSDWFEKAVRNAFENQGYTVKSHQRYNRRADSRGDADILITLPDRYGLFELPPIVVQVKWKQNVDQNDTHAIEQITDWARDQDSDAVKCVLSSADEFTDEAKREADENGVVLIGGLQTMCFLLGEPERYRDDWKQPD